MVPLPSTDTPGLSHFYTEFDNVMAHLALTAHSMEYHLSR